jgi:hypothetical protein
MAAHTAVWSLLEQLQATFPARQARVERLVAGLGGPRGTYQLVVSPPESAKAIATFDPRKKRQLTPMLRDRFKYAGTWHQGRESWLAVSEVPRLQQTKEVQSYHAGLRDNYDESAPWLVSR